MRSAAAYADKQEREVIVSKLKISAVKIGLSCDLRPLAARIGGFRDAGINVFQCKTG